MKSVALLRVIIGVTVIAVSGVVSLGGDRQKASAATPPDSCFAFTVGTGTITDYYDNEGNNGANPACTRDVDIPSTIGGTPVTAIGSSAFNNANNQLTSLTIPSSVTSIGTAAFRSNQLTSLTIPSSVTTIGTSAFQYNQLTSVTIPSSVTSIGTAAFRSNQLTSLTIPSSVTTIGTSAFANNQLTSLTIPSTVTSIGSYAFSENEITTPNIVGSPTILGEGILQKNPITSINYNGTIYTESPTIPEECFRFDSGTVTAYMLYDLNLIKTDGIACMKHDVIDIPNVIGGTAVTTIGEFVFEGIELTSVTIPNSVTSIEGGAFENNQLTSLILPSSLVSIGWQAFQNNDLTTVTIPSDVTSIGSFAFLSNQLTSVTIPNSVTSIEYAAFQSNQLTSVTIPNSVTSIDDNAFSYNHLTSLTLPSSLTSIGEEAFAYNNLTTLTLPSSLTSIGEYAFTYNELTSLTIPSSVTSIDPTAFTLQNPWGRNIDGDENGDPLPGVPYLYSDDPAIVQQAYDAIWYVRLYTEDPTNPNDLQDAALSEEVWQGGDANDNGTATDSLGGHLINPASLQLQYVNQADASIQTTQTFTGLLDGDYLNSYLVSQGPIIPIPADPENPTLSEQQAIDDAFAAYYRIGDEVAITPPAIQGYNTPPTQTFVLGAATNEYSYVYAAQSSGSGSGSELASTGMNHMHIVALAVSSITLGTGVYVIRRMRTA